MAGKQGRPYKYSTETGELDIKTISERIDAYIEKSEQDNVYTLAALRLALDNIDTSTLRLWEHGYTNKEDYENDNKQAYNKELSSAIKRAKLKIEDWLSKNSNSQRQSKDIFLLKNWFGYVDKQEQDVNINANIKFDLADVDKYSN